MQASTAGYCSICISDLILCTMNKHQRILQDIAHAHLPEYAQPGQLNTILTNWRHYNVEHIVEVAMCRVGNYQFVDENHYDNSDFSDTKTGTCRRHDRTAVIGNILSRKTLTPKAGDIRAVIYNEFTEELDYFFLPKAHWEDLREYGDSNQHLLRTKYTVHTDRYTKWEQFRVNSFKDLACVPSTIASIGSYAAIDSPKNVLFSWA